MYLVQHLSYCIIGLMPTWNLQCYYHFGLCVHIINANAYKYHRLTDCRIVIDTLIHEPQWVMAEIFNLSFNHFPHQPRFGKHFTGHRRSPTTSSLSRQSPSISEQTANTVDHTVPFIYTSSTRCLYTWFSAFNLDRYYIPQLITPVQKTQHVVTRISPTRTTLDGVGGIGYLL